MYYSLSPTKTLLESLLVENKIGVTYTVCPTALLNNMLSTIIMVGRMDEQELQLIGADMKWKKVGRKCR